MPKAFERDRSARAEVVETFAETLRHVDRYFVEPVDVEAIGYDAVRSILAQLDADSAFLAPSEYRRLHEDTGGRHSGVGISLSANDGAAPVIARVVAGSPAARAQLAAGDRISAVDGIRAAELGERAAARFEEVLRGPAGSHVDIVALLDGAEKPLRLTREPVAPPSVQWTIAEEGVGILAIERFQEGTGREVARALSGIARSTGYPLSGVVLDLRGNPGGLLDAAIDVADLFLDDGLIASVRGRRGAIVSQWRARAAGTFNRVPLLVLIDRDSASAAEILAGSLQDHGRAVIAGDSSYGKGSVQTLFDLPGGSGLRLTTSHYFTAADRAIGKDGLAPDVRLGEDLLAGASVGSMRELKARWSRDGALVWAVNTLQSGSGELAAHPGGAGVSR